MASIMHQHMFGLLDCPVLCQQMPANKKTNLKLHLYMSLVRQPFYIFQKVEYSILHLSFNIEVSARL